MRTLWLRISSVYAQKWLKMTLEMLFFFVGQVHRVTGFYIAINLQVQMMKPWWYFSSAPIKSSAAKALLEPFHTPGARGLSVQSLVSGQCSCHFYTQHKVWFEAFLAHHRSEAVKGKCKTDQPEPGLQSGNIVFLAVESLHSSDSKMCLHMLNTDVFSTLATNVMFQQDNLIPR